MTYKGSAVAYQGRTLRATANGGPGLWDRKKNSIWITGHWSLFSVPLQWTGGNKLAFWRCREQFALFESSLGTLLCVFLHSYFVINPVFRTFVLYFKHFQRCIEMSALDAQPKQFRSRSSGQLLKRWCKNVALCPNLAPSPGTEGTYGFKQRPKLGPIYYNCITYLEIHI